MLTEPRAMREIHEIRKKIHERIKDMTPEEHVEYFNRRSGEILKKYDLEHLKAVSPAGALEHRAAKAGKTAKPARHKRAVQVHV